MSNTQAATPNTGITVRRLDFAVPDDVNPHWHPTEPEWSHMVNGASLCMPYLEPYLIKAVKAAKPHIADSRLLAEADDYIGQEAHHYKQHRKFNDILISHGYDELRDIEQRMADDFARFLRDKPLAFHLAYTAGFESMALGIGHWLVRERERLFGGADSSVASLVLWHFVEEIEHKNVALDVYRAACGGYWRRIHGLFCATLHVIKYSRQAYQAMLKRDGLWHDVRSRWRLQKMLLRFLGALVPHILRCCIPGHEPRDIPDPAWTDAWVERYKADDGRLTRLDTSRLAAGAPA